MSPPWQRTRIKSAFLSVVVEKKGNQQTEKSSKKRVLKKKRERKTIEDDNHEPCKRHTQSRIVWESSKGFDLIWSSIWTYSPSLIRNDPPSKVQRTSCIREDVVYGAWCIPNYVRNIVDNIDRNKSFNRDIVRHPSFFFFFNCRHETHSQVADAICRKLEWIQWWHKTDTTIRVSLSIVYITGPLIYDYYLQRFHLKLETWRANEI